MMVSVVEPEMPLNVAVMFAVPAALAVHRPPPVCPLLMVASFDADELQ